MLSFGINIQTPGDPLQKTTIEVIARRIIHPSSEFSQKIQQLRNIRMIDEKQYRRIKITLPYFCCGIFSPAVRRKENFAAISYFALDFDHFSTEGISKETAIEKLVSLPQLQLLFTTPSGDGLKAVFRIAERCTDLGLYTAFYKAFANHIALTCGLEKVIDPATYDVTRAVFFSADPQAYFNIDAAPINIREFISDDQDSLLKAEADFQALIKENRLRENTTAVAPTDDTLVIIKQKLYPEYRPKKQKLIVAPKEIDSILGTIETELNKHEIQLKESRPISYGRQLTVQMGRYAAQLNVFYGKNGFTVVRTTKTGTNPELASLAWQVLDAFL